MDLNKIQLPSFAFKELFNNCVIPIPDIVLKEQDPNSPIPFVGQNKKKITILVKVSNADFLTDGNQRFLTDILLACKLNLTDVAIINLYKTPAINLQMLTSIFSPRMILMFDILPSAIQLSAEIPLFKMQKLEDIIYLCTPSLDELETNSVLKKELWLQLKQIFLI